MTATMCNTRGTAALYRHGTTALFSVKGGSGVSVTAALAARRWADTQPGGSALIDLCGDQPGLLSFPCSPSRAGVAEWLRGRVEQTGLPSLLAEVAPGMDLLCRGNGALVPAALRQWGSGARPAHVLDPPLGMLAETFAGTAAVLDAGNLWEHPGVRGGDSDVWARTQYVIRADRAWLVVRSCFLALRRAAGSPVKPHGVVLLVEEGRAITARDVEDVVDAPVVVRIAVEPAVARSVDAGLMSCRMQLTAALRQFDAAADSDGAS